MYRKYLQNYQLQAFDNCNRRTNISIPLFQFFVTNFCNWQTRGRPAELALKSVVFKPSRTILVSTKCARTLSAFTDISELRSRLRSYWSALIAVNILNPT